MSDDVTEMWLCEAHNVVLRPNRLYRFKVRDGCDKCAEYADAYERDPTTEGGGEDE